MKELTDQEAKANRARLDTDRPGGTQRLPVKIGGLVAAALGGFALMGWLLAMPRLASLGQGLIPMAPSTAVLFIVYGLVFLSVHRATHNRLSRLFCLAVCAVCACVSTALLILSSQRVYFAIERLGILAPGDMDGTPIGYMSPVTACTFLLISLSFLLLLGARPVRPWRAIAALWTAILLIAAYVMLILTYLFGTPMFYGGTFIPPAATTSLAFLALATALLALARPLAWSETERNDPEIRASFHLLITVFILLAAGIIAAGYFYHRKQEKHYLAEIEHQLSAIADLKKGELLLWREERLADAGLFHHNLVFSGLVKTMLNHPERAEARQEIEAWVGRIQLNRNYNRIFLLDASAASRWSLPENIDEPLSPYVYRQALEALRTGQITFADFYRNESNGKIYLSILVPLFDPADADEPLGVLVMRIDPEKYLYPFIERWPGTSATAETLLVRREGNTALFLNRLKFSNNAPLNLSLPLEKTEIPAVMAVSGREGAVRGIDYRGHPVLAALRAIPGTPWYLVTRMDLEEIYAPLRERQGVTVLLVCAMLVSAGTGIGFVWRRQRSHFYREKYEAERERHELEERLTRIAANVPGALFQYQLHPDGSISFPYASDGLEALYGLRPGEGIRDTSALFARIHPDDVTQVTETILESARTLTVWHNEHRVVHPERGTIWVEGNATPERKPDGSVLLHGFLAEITERKEAEKEIEQQNSELERFTYTVSHDLKSPLVTIKTFLGYLTEDIKQPDNPRVQQDLGFINAAADKMSQLLAELLELSRVGRLNNPPQEAAFRELVEEAVQLDAGRISARRVTVVINDAPVVLCGDRSRLVEIWQNLVENACKFMGSQEDPRIEIGVENHGQETVFFVKDNGIGIEQRFHSKVFGLFEKLEGKGEGTGLGLALVKRIVELYEGRIRIESAGEGQGTTFFFTLPKAIKKG